MTERTRTAARIADADALRIARDTLEVMGGRDFRLNGCVCNERGKCYLHDHNYPILVAVFNELAADCDKEPCLDERDAAVAALRQILAYDMTQPGPPIMAMWEIAREALAAVGEAEEQK